jgi:hypothetical protein
VEGESNQKDYKNASSTRDFPPLFDNDGISNLVSWNQAHQELLQESGASSLVGGSVTQYAMEMQYTDESQHPRQQSMPFSQFRTDCDPPYMPKENLYKTVDVEPSLVGQPNGGPAFPSSGFGASQRWIEGSRAQEYGSAYTLPKPERPVFEHGIIFQPIQMDGGGIPGSVPDGKGRHRPLSPGKRKKASEMRMIRACLRCRLSKVEVSLDYVICETITISNDLHTVL